MKVMENVAKELKSTLDVPKEATPQEENWEALRHELLQEGMANYFQ
jgi:hypothetical protein